ncbi:BamA/TamA family outer membrane protein [Fulvivirga sp. M361]|uniref:BamA/TamA family outer membrane protein n=1 Tax=Fulvivirga sp. M361 TaxID=2594266 RepID=UPI00117A9CDD|nr:BamA/TamA family outer membrane protein [Fulvivirga sp. M361]TRX54286.1 BamA/TamA family outer membrane protein [Fulvivirga sp. M361]
MVRQISLGLLCLAGSFTVKAQSQDSTHVDKKVKINLFPVAFYSPESRFGFGALATGIFNLGDPKDTRVSNVQTLGAYTINDQVIFQVKNNIFLKDESYAFFGELSYFDFPIFYYGIGNDSKEENEEDLDYKVISFEQRVLKKITEYHFAGFNYSGVRVFDLKFEPQFLIEDLEQLESDVGLYSGLGLSYIYDSRDNLLNAFEGNFLEVSTLFNGDLTGSDFTFARYRLDARKYWKLKDDHILAAQFLGVFTEGDVPFREIALLGGDQIMRGYYRGRFRDKNQLAAQVEYRRQIITWLGVVVFGAMGDVARSVDSFSLGDFKWAGGGGLRLMINEKDRLNVRVDYGIGKDTSGLYFGLSESF